MVTRASTVNVPISSSLTLSLPTHSKLFSHSPGVVVVAGVVVVGVVAAVGNVPVTHRNASWQS